jgi:hypothetical protein
MILDRVRAQADGFGDLPVGLTGRHETQDPKLALIEGKIVARDRQVCLV